MKAIVLSMPSHRMHQLLTHLQVMEYGREKVCNIDEADFANKAKPYIDKKDGYTLLRGE